MSKTQCILSESFAHVKWEYNGRSGTLFAFLHCSNMYSDALLLSLPPVYSLKQMVNGEWTIFSSKTSFLFRNNNKGTYRNHFIRQILLKSCKDSCIRLTSQSSNKTWSYSDIAITKIKAFTPSKWWIHFLLSDRWPPTSMRHRIRFSLLKCVSLMPKLIQKNYKVIHRFIILI